MNVLEVKNLTVSYDNNVAVDDISFDVKEGDLLGIVGPNGAGKTTLFRAILGLEQPSSGTIRLFGYESSKYRLLLPMIGYVPQKVIFEPNFPATIFDIVSMGIISNKRLEQCAKLIQQCGYNWNRVYKDMKKDSDKVSEAIKAVGLKSIQDRRIGEISSGELQRVFIAKSLVKDPLLLILDEPVTSVDMDAQNKFYNVIKKLNSENGITIIWSSHDLEAISKYASKVSCMNRKLFFHGEKKEFFSDKELLKTYAESAMQMHMHDHGL